ncbi:MAG: hypothetical protein LUE11_04705 [Clostridia bacterium]|nr:hypothetical protein [Clostridia bacterium]
MTPKITNAGYSAIIKALNGAGLTFTKIVIGNGGLPDDYTNLTNMVNSVAEIGITSATEGNQYVELNGTISNADISSAFYWTEVGVFCTDSDGGDDILYAYGHCKMSSDTEIYIPAAGESVLELTLNYFIYIGEAENVSAILSESAQYATKANLKEHIDDTNNPHKVTAEQVGLGNVENVAPSDMKVNYSLRTSLANLVSGETLKQSFSKLAFAVSSLISHLQNTVIHVTKEEREGWNDKAAGTHTHATSDINSGILGVTRGGTGKGSWSANRMIYPSGSTAFTQLPFPTVINSVLMQNLSGAPFWTPLFQSGSYIGTNTSGSENKNSITFSGKIPSIVFIFQSDNSRIGIIHTSCSKGQVILAGESSVNTNEICVSTDGTTLSWYYNSTESHPANQLNGNTTYYYVGLL